MVGISHECDFPEDVRGLPVCSEPRIDTGRPGGQIDRGVRELVRESASIYHVRTEVLERLRPDLIVTQDHCHVCAVSLADVEQACSTLAHKLVRVCSLETVRIYREYIQPDELRHHKLGWQLFAKYATDPESQQRAKEVVGRVLEIATAARAQAAARMGTACFPGC